MKYARQARSLAGVTLYYILCVEQRNCYGGEKPCAVQRLVAARRLVFHLLKVYILTLIALKDFLMLLAFTLRS